MPDMPAFTAIRVLIENIRSAEINDVRSSAEEGKAGTKASRGSKKIKNFIIFNFLFLSF